MIFQIFSFCLRFKPIRHTMLALKKIPARFQLVKMIREWNEKDYIFQCSKICLVGKDTLNEIDLIQKQFNFKNPLLVTDKVLIENGVVKKVTKRLDDLNVKYHVFDGVEPNPSTAVIKKIVYDYNAQKCDALISIGGGSAHDSIKAASLVITNNDPDIYGYQGLNVTKQIASMPIIGINTTAGTGAGVTNVAVITDEAHHFKMTLVDKNIQPIALIDDSDLMMKLPPTPTAWVGIDTLVHAIESYLSNVQSLITQAYAQQTMHIVYKYLPLVFANPSNAVAREKMAYAEFMGGIAFNQTSLGFIHSMSHALSGVYNTPHGLANAILLPYVLDYELNNNKIVRKLCKISDFMGIVNKYGDDYNKAKECVRKIVSLLKILNIPSSISEIQKNITDDKINELAKKAMKDFCGISNPIQLNKRQIIHIYKNAIAGNFENIKE